jgi:RNA polymerase sigma-70 factor (ECF subfamily)
VSAGEDFALLDRWHNGDASAGEALFRRHFDSIYNFFETKCETEADELVQATFLACVRARDQFRKDASFRTYLFTIARHELYRVLRQRQRDGERLDFDVSSVAELVSTPGTKIARNQEHRQLIEALQRLPLEQQTLLELHYWEEMGVSELAEIFEAQAATIRQRLYRARTALRDVMARTAPKGALDTLESMDAWARQFVRT